MLVEILEDLKVIIRLEKLYDPRNISVIICDPDLGAALTKVRDQVLKQLIRIRLEGKLQKLYS